MFTRDGISKSLSHLAYLPVGGDTMKLDYNKMMEAEIALLQDRKPSLLLHSCCAPCTSSVLERLYPHFEITLFYYNPNTHPYEEFLKRGEELPKLLERSGMTDVKIITGRYDDDRYFEMVRGLEGEAEGGSRCNVCFDIRLSETQKLANELSFDYFCTTLSVSPHKNAELINSIGSSLASPEGSRWLPADFKKKNGYLRSIELSRQYELYRQCYCGCVYSMRDLAVQEKDVKASE